MACNTIILYLNYCSDYVHHPMFKKNKHGMTYKIKTMNSSKCNVPMSEFHRKSCMSITISFICLCWSPWCVLVCSCPYHSSTYVYIQAAFSVGKESWSCPCAWINTMSWRHLRNGGRALHIVNFSIRQRWVVCSCPSWCTSEQEPLVPTEETGQAPRLVWML